MSRHEVVGVVPAAGRGRRLGGGASKEVVAVGHDPDGAPRPVTSHLLERFRLGGVGRAYVVLRAGKWDVPATLGDGARWGVDLSYRTVESSFSVCHSVDSAWPVLRDRIVALGFPDILFEPRDAYRHCLERLRASSAAVVLGLFPADRPDKTDMVELDEDGRPQRFFIKQPDRGLRYTWSIAVWRPATTELLHRWWRAQRQRLAESSTARERGPEVHFGDFLSWALGRLEVDAVPFPQGRYLDVGTPEDLERARDEASP